MKNLLLSLSLAVTASTCFAQLYVKPIDANSNGTVDTNDAPAFLYANDVIVYVDGDIGMTLNPTNPTYNPDGIYEGSFYLRGDSQLFQGNSGTGNSGNGMLSVYQTSNSDAWDYNFWASPVGEPAGAAGNRNYGILRIYDIEGGSRTKSNQTGVTNAFNGWSGTGASTGNPSVDMKISTRWLYRYEPATDWQSIYAGENVPVGRGFTMKGTNESAPHSNEYVDPNTQTYDFRGRPNSGTISIPITNNQSILTGNPYPSALDLARVFQYNPSGLIDHILFWDEDRSIDSHLYVANKGGYGQWVPAGANDSNNLPGLYTPAPFLSYTSGGLEIPNSNPSGYEGADLSRRYAPIAQGFMILGDSNGTLSFTNAMRVYNPLGVNGSTFRSAEGTQDGRNASGFAVNENVSSNNSGLVFTGNESVIVQPTVENEISHLTLNAYIPGSHRRIMELAFDDVATDGFDYGYDATHPMDATTEVYMPLLDGRKTIIQTTNFSIDKIIPIGIEADIPGSILFYAMEENNMPVADAWLYDAALNTYQKITGGENANINIAQAGTIENRFYIVFQNQEVVEETLSEKSGLTKALASVDVFQNNRLGFMDIMNPEGFDIKNAQVYDMGGKLVHTESNIGTQTRYNFPTSNLADGVYIVKLLAADNLVLDYKVTVHNIN